MTSPAHAATQAILGKQLQIAEGVTKRTVTGAALERHSASTVIGDPTAGGATLLVIATGGTSSTQTFDLPSAGWTRAGAAGFKWSNRSQPAHPVKRASITKSQNGTFRLMIQVKGAATDVTVGRRTPERAAASSSRSRAGTATASPSAERRAASRSGTTAASGRSSDRAREHARRRSR